MKKISLFIIFIVAFFLTSCTNNQQTEVTKTPIPSVSAGVILSETTAPSKTPIPTFEPIQSEQPIEEVYIIDELLFGSWVLEDGITYMELTEDGKLIDNGIYRADYKVLENNKVKILSINNNTQPTVLSYELNDNQLHWGSDSPTCRCYHKKNHQPAKEEINFENYRKLSSEPMNFWYIKNKDHIPSAFDASLTTLLDQYNCVYIGDTTDNKVYFTTDMGYENGNTEYLLDYYKDKNIKILFFLTGDYIDYHPDLVQRMIDEGHLIGNHTYHHYNLGTISLEKAYAEIKSVDDKLMDKFGITCKYLRYPEGGFSEQVLALTKDMGYTPVFWSGAFRDWSREDTHDVSYFYEEITNRLHNGALLLIHNVIKNETHSLPDVIKYMEDNNYELGNIKEYLENY